jgi:hypothetical protein
MPTPAPMLDPTTGLPSMDVNGQPAMGQQMQPSIPPPGERHIEHNDLVHLAEHKKWANSDVVVKLLHDNPNLRPVLDWFIGQHEQAVMMQQAQQAMLAGGSGQPGGGGRAMERSNNQTETTSNVPSGNGEGAQNQGPM